MTKGEKVGLVIILFALYVRIMANTPYATYEWSQTRVLIAWGVWVVGSLIFAASNRKG